MTVIDVIINGQAHQFPAGTVVETAISQWVKPGQRIAVERNGDIVPRSQHANTALQHGDQLEIVVAVGGG
ncbi:sulfur carrier protein ThiS [Aquaspirillum serpens]|uniref:sulfur carrier protein ThiS n=1 Tax=Aquaspirillum serpens TaxID=190 RepID=UPI0003B38B97|nr:sulfur carrier protein ThiS [Aquaspirillum serpens]